MKVSSNNNNKKPSSVSRLCAISLLLIAVVVIPNAYTNMVLLSQQHNILDGTSSSSSSSSTAATIPQQQNVRRHVDPTETTTSTTSVAAATTANTIVGSSGGAWTAETHLQQYGFNVDAGLVRVLEASCRDFENERNIETKWSKHPSQDSPIGGLWRPPANVDCSVLELGSGVGVYVDALKKDQAKKKRKVFGVEPNRMGGVYERRNGPKQLLVDIMASKDPNALAQTIRQEHLAGAGFDVLVSIEVCEHMPPDRHTDAAQFLAGLARPGTKLIFGAAHPNQGGTGHIGNRSQREWEMILKDVGFVKDPQQTLTVAHELDEFNHKVNTQVFFFTPPKQ